MPKINANGIDIYYEIQGQGEPLVLIAGFSTDHNAWRSVVNRFAKHYQVIVFDNRGAGQTTVTPGPYTMDQLADDVAALCNALQIKQAHFIGSSMGGYMLQCLAYRYADLVKSAVMSNTTFATHTCFHLYKAAHLELIKAKAPAEALIKSFCAWVFSYQFLAQPGVLDSLITLSLNNPYPFSVQGYEAQNKAIDTFDSRNWIGKIKTPTLVIGADQDLIFSEASIRALAEKIPHAQYYCMQNCGHAPQIEYPELFVDTVMKWIQTGTL